jgi:recombinational DNA repair protein (RecF pathway)
MADTHPQLFEHLLELLKNMRDRGHSTGRLRAESRGTIALLILFQLSLLKEVGLGPVVSACANCKTKHEIRDARYEVYFSSSANGLICCDCEGSFPDKIKITRASAGCLGNVNMIPNADEKTL